MIHGWYYLHINKELIYKNSPDAISDIRESDLCHSAWPFDAQDRASAWRILVEALALGANKSRINKLSSIWNCNDVDAKNYADYLGITLGIDGNVKYAHRKDFINLQESAIGFGETYLEAMSELAKELGFTGGKMWNSNFKSLCQL